MTRPEKDTLWHKDVNDIGQHYKDLKFGDFKHGVTGAMLWKGHPGSKAGRGSASCRVKPCCW